MGYTTPTVSLSVESIFHSEGRVFNTNTGTTSADALRYEYAIRDHLGNTRLTFTDKNNDGKVDVVTGVNNEVLQENHYYPFGLAMNGPWMNDAAIDNKYQYNGKELNDDFGIGLNDYGARWYDAAVGRWWGVDPLAEMVARESAYCYGGNNPIKNVDIGGLFKFPQGENGEFKALNEYLKSTDLSRLLNDPDIRNGLMTLGKFTDQEINDLAAYGKGPVIQIVCDAEILGVGGEQNTAEANGSYAQLGDADRNADHVFNISQTLAEQFENATPDNKQATLLLLISTILHESIHVGRHMAHPIPPNTLTLGNWSKRGAVYRFRNNIIGLDESYDRNDVRSPANYNQYIQEMGKMFEDAIWGDFKTKRGDEGTKEAKEKINSTNSNIIPRA